jgi:hypothetical protein
MARRPHPNNEANRLARELRLKGRLEQKAELEKARRVLVENPHEGAEGEIKQLDQRIAEVDADIWVLSPPPPRNRKRRS